MSISVVFSAPDAVFYPGQNVSGIIKIDLPEPVNARKMTVEIDGSACCNWTKTEQCYINMEGMRNSQWRRMYFISTLTYLNEEAVLWERQNDDEMLPAGHHEFPFRCMLPDDCAPSFEGEFGSIRYMVKVEIDRIWNFDQTNRSFFTVSRTVDLNEIPHALEPAFDRNRDEIGVMMFKHGEVEVEIQLPKSGYVPGESIVVDALIKNFSTRPIVSADLKLKQSANFTAIRDGWSGRYAEGLIIGGGETKNHKRLVAEVNVPLDIQPKSEGKARVALVVPPTAPSLSNCPTVEVKYFVVFKVTSKGTFHNNVECSADVVIGTVPLKLHGSSFLEPPRHGGIARDAPPSYEESVYGPEATKDLASDESFTPRYPFYRQLSLGNGLISAPEVKEL